MNTFLENVVEDVLSRFNSLNGVVFILPSNRSIRAMRSLIAQKVKAPIFSPEMFSVEEFMRVISGLKPIDEFQQSLKLYNIYKSLETDETDSFSNFYGWANTILGDFNEIDRHLIPPQKLFDYLTAIERIRNWTPESEQTRFISEHLAYSNTVSRLYFRFNTELLAEKKGTQGLHYRKASEQVGKFALENSKKTFLFIGLNALNEAEKQIINHLLEQTNSYIYWNLDNCFFQDPVHEAGYFIRKNNSFFAKYSNRQPLHFSSNYLEKEKISITGAPKNNAQAQFVGQLLSKISTDEERTALVLADESILPLILSALPNTTKEYNISMGYPLKLTQTSKFLFSFLRLKQNLTIRGYYHKNVLSFLSHSFISQFVKKSSILDFIKIIQSQNITHVSVENFSKLFTSRPLASLFSETQKPTGFIPIILDLLYEISTEKNNVNNGLEREAICQIRQFLSIYNSNLSDYPFLDNLKSLESLLRDFINKNKVSFKGNPDKGLQIMGVLETRTLDFETVIVTSLNEGILPAGKSVNSLMPHDVKKEFGLPTVKEKDAIYAYHFYRLLQRAKQVYLVYNTEPDVLNGGEPSRFIHQIMADSSLKPFISHNLATLQLNYHPRVEKSVIKTSLLMKELTEKAQKGFSPSSLSDYIKNPYTFYKRHILKIQEPENVDENIAYNVLGSIIHDALESLYKTLPKDVLQKSDLESIRVEIEPKVLSHFQKHYAKSSIFEGKNFIVFNVILKYVSSVIEKDIAQITHHSVKLLALEENLKTSLDLESMGLKAVLKGKLDRLDEIDGKVRIIDYKTGKVEKSGLKINTIDELFSEPKYGQAFQLLCYALMNKKMGIKTDAAGILPIKKPSENLILLSYKNKKENPCSCETLERFELKLKELYQEILNPDIPFQDTGL